MYHFAFIVCNLCIIIQPTCLSFCLSVWPAGCLFVYPSMLCVCLSPWPSVWLPACLSIHRSVRRPIQLFVPAYIPVCWLFCCLFVYLFVKLPACVYFRLYLSQPTWYLPLCLLVYVCISDYISVCLPAYLPVSLSVCLPACLPASLHVCCLPACLSTCLLPACLSVYLPVCLSLCLLSFSQTQYDFVHHGHWLSTFFNKNFFNVLIFLLGEERKWLRNTRGAERTEDDMISFRNISLSRFSFLSIYFLRVTVRLQQR